MQPMLQIETRAGNPVFSHGIKIIPFSQSVRLSFPGAPAGLIWNRPVSVLAVNTDGSERVIPVEDITRRIQLALLGTSLLGGFILWLISQKHNSRKGNDHE